ncbi:MAG: hypothetical protein AB7F89_10610 [Pirellulaceae bacterium]
MPMYAAAQQPAAPPAPVPAAPPGAPIPNAPPPVHYGGEYPEYGGTMGGYGGVYGDSEYAGGMYGDGMYGDGMYGDGMYGDGGMCADGSCDPAYFSPDAYPPNVLGNFIHGLLPYSEGGRCAPRWYDIGLDAMYIKREDIGNNVAFASRTPGVQNAVLTTGNLNYDEELGFRFNAAVMTGPGTNLEFTYFGLFNWASSSQVADPTNQLFSVFSNFGTTLPLSDQADLSQFQSIGTSSTIDNFELNVRRRWVGPNCRTQGSWLAGVRYVYLLDDLRYFTLGRNGVGGTPVGQSDTLVRARNSMTGFQAGGDLWANVLPGISVGGDLKAGVYGNYAKQNTNILSTLTNNTTALQPEEASNNDVAVIGEANLMFIYRVRPNITVRGGYSFLYIDGLALAVDNFNPTNPFNNNRAVRELTDSAHVLYHGGFLGFEWMW